MGNYKNNITSLSLFVLTQVMLFVFIYLFSIAIGAGLLYLVFHVSIWGVPLFFENVVPYFLNLGRLGFVAIIFCIVAIVGLWAFIIAIGLYLVKPLFIFPKRNYDYGVELKREDAPELYDLILTTAKETGVKPPRHIFVNQEINACVFYNTNFWNIFFPTKKNLVIGLGLFKGTSVSEVKSILAHEFGHFAQNSMRVGSILYVSNKVISGLVYRRDILDSYLIKWCLHDGIWGFWGTATQSIIIRFRALIEFFFKLQQRNYLKLSRQMELDADSIACKVCGSKNFISAICKVEIISKSFNFYDNVLSEIISKNKIVDDYWAGYDVVCTHAPNNVVITNFDKSISAPENLSTRSLIRIDEIWETHPSINKRVEYANNLNIILPESKGCQNASWDLVSDKLKRVISDKILSKAININKCIVIDMPDFELEVSEHIKNNLIPERLAPFLNRNFIVFSFETDNESLSSLADIEIFSDKNELIISEYEQAIIDKQLLYMLNDGKLEVNRLSYRDTPVDVNDIPIEQHEKYIETLKQSVIWIEKSIRSYIDSLTDDAKMVDAAYKAIEYSQLIVTRLETDFVPVRKDIIKELNAGNIAGEGDFASLREWLDSYECALKDVLKSINYEKISPFISHEERIHMEKFIEHSRSFMFGISSDAANHMFYVTDWIIRVHNNLKHHAKKYLAEIIMGQSPVDSDAISLWLDDEERIKRIEETENKDGNERLKISTDQGILKFIVPPDDDIDKIYYQEWFRCHMMEKLLNKNDNQPFNFQYVCTVQCCYGVDGSIVCTEESSKEKFNVEFAEYNRFIEDNTEPNWDDVEEAADHGNSYAVGRLAYRFLRHSQQKQAYDFALHGAFANDPLSLVVLGIILRDGLGVDEDTTSALKLFKYASSLGGHKLALFNLGIYYLNNLDGIKDERKAFKYIERAAEQGLPQAEFQIGIMALDGIGIDTSDADRALYWLYRAANHGIEDAVNCLWKYYKDIGDIDEYHRIVNQGARQGINECISEINKTNNNG